MQSRVILAVSVATVFLLILGGVALGHIVGTSRPRAQQAACLANMRQVAMGMLMYSADYDTKLPPAERWSSRLDPYLRSEHVFRCPAVPRSQCGYAMNRPMSGAPVPNVSGSSSAVMLFESSVGRLNTADAMRSIDYRHGGAAHVATLDGRVNLIRAERP